MYKILSEGLSLIVTDDEITNLRCIRHQLPSNISSKVIKGPSFTLQIYFVTSYRVTHSTDFGSLSCPPTAALRERGCFQCISQLSLTGSSE